jgi:hypothetical protein
MYKKTLTATALALCLSAMAQAQSIAPSVISSGGDFFSNSAGMIEWTVGEPMIETYSASSFFITQGFHQPEDVNSSIGETGIPVNASVYPNPTADFVNIQFGEDVSGLFVIDIYNALGQRMQTEQFSAFASGRKQINLTGYAAGVYFIQVRAVNGKANTTFKITKNS